MRVSRLLALAPTFLLAACLTDSKEQLAAKKAGLAANDDEICRSYGAKPGTDVYVQCRMSQQQNRDAAASAQAAAASVVTPAPIPVSPVETPRLRNILPEQTRCQSVRVGVANQTVCNRADGKASVGVTTAKRRASPFFFLGGNDPGPLLGPADLVSETRTRVVTRRRIVRISASAVSKRSIPCRARAVSENLINRPTMARVGSSK
jgi:hypothetical protein